MYEQFLEHFGDVHQFLVTLQSSLSGRSHLLAVFEDQQQLNSLKLELAITVDAAKPFVRKTYTLEGEGPLALEAYCHLKEVATTAVQKHYPNTSAIAAVITDDDGDEAK